MLAQEEQNDPMPCALLFVDQLFLKIRDMIMPGKREELLDIRYHIYSRVITISLPSHYPGHQGR